MDYTHNEYIRDAGVTLILDDIRIAYMNKLYEILNLIMEEKNGN